MLKMTDFLSKFHCF